MISIDILTTENNINGTFDKQCINFSCPGEEGPRTRGGTVYIEMKMLLSVTIWGRWVHRALEGCGEPGQFAPGSYRWTRHTGGSEGSRLYLQHTHRDTHVKLLLQVKPQLALRTWVQGRQKNYNLTSNKILHQTCYLIKQEFPLCVKNLPEGVVHSQMVD